MWSGIKIELTTLANTCVLLHEQHYIYEITPCPYMFTYDSDFKYDTKQSLVR